MKDCVFKKNKEVIFRQEGDEAILFNPETSDIVVINSIGCFIWSKCDGKNTSGDIVKNILEEFETTEEIAKKDFQKFISDLEKMGFIKKYN